MQQPLKLSVLLSSALVALAEVGSPMAAQDSDRAAWFAFAGVGELKGPAEGRLRWWFDAHSRFFEDSDGFETSIIRPGVGYALSANTTAWMGYAWIENDPRSGSFTEQRFWQQLTWGRRFDWGTPFLRTRLEQRIDERDSDTGWRLRQFVRWTRPVTEGSPYAWRLWNEGFYDLNDTGWGQDTGFRQNRAFAGVGLALVTGLTLEVGYLNQYLSRNEADDSSNHVLAVTLLGSF